MSNQQAILEIEQLSVSYDAIKAVKGISLHVKQGEIVALIGTNGSGKTSTLQSISGLHKNNQGTIRFEGKDITKLEPHKIVAAGISQVPEGRGVLADLTVLENLSLGAYVRKDKKNIALDLQSMFELFPRLAERKKQLAGTMSGGEQQMLAIARALMARPKLLLLDEPSMGLAPIIVKEIFQAIKKINKDGVSILLVEQNANMALSAADRGYVMETGSIVVEDVAENLRSNDIVKSVYLGISN
ncbi:ABC transporter ATP-binding protein [Paenibacillus sp. FSL W7-1287]|nr:ABC transporter ATP-binding protein [Paenibacillus camelliae]MCM3634517.1 ABC transporter ATP-binding protein [Paenibacillus camelliae]